MSIRSHVYLASSESGSTLSLMQPFFENRPSYSPQLQSTSPLIFASEIFIWPGRITSKTSVLLSQDAQEWEREISLDCFDTGEDDHEPLLLDFPNLKNGLGLSLLEPA